MTMTGRSGPTGSARQPTVASTAGPSAAAESVPGYRGLARIGHGGFSVVYRAVQESFERDVALKVLTVGTDEEARRRFMREVRLAGRLSGHPHVVTILDAGSTESGRPYLAMDLYDGGSMKERLRRTGPLSAAETAMVGAKIADALAAAHSLGVLHRDVTPNNILVSRFGEPALADFGVSCLLDGASSASVMDIFSPQHAAPELMTRGVPTASSDVYALGSTLYQLLTGRPPFGGDTRDVRAIMFRVVSEPPPRPDCPELPELADAIVRAMAKEPDERYEDAAEFARTLRALIPEGTPTALPMPYPGELPETAVLSREAGSTSASGSISASASFPTSMPASMSSPTGSYRSELDTASSRRLPPAPDETMVRPDRADPSQSAAPAPSRRGAAAVAVAGAGGASGSHGGEGQEDRHKRRKLLPLVLVALLALLGIGTWALLQSQKPSTAPRDLAVQQHSSATAVARVTPTPTPTRPTPSATPKPKRSTLAAAATASSTPVAKPSTAAQPSASPSASSGSNGSLLPLPGTYHRLKNQQAGSCLTQSAALASCAASKSEGWQYSLSLNGLLGGDYELINEQSGACLTETSNGRVGAQACDGSTSQLWSMMNGSGSGKEFQNAGGRQCLQVAQAVVSVGSCSTSDRADLWNEDGTS
jgi:serine/threonine protein kinase